MSTQNAGLELPMRWRLDDGPSHNTHNTARPVRAVSTSDLFLQGEHEIAIQHGDSIYSLKITRQDRLVLNK